MKNTKRRLEYFSFYNHTGIENHLAEMAKKGWMIQSISNLYWTYRKIEPKKQLFAELWDGHTLLRLLSVALNDLTKEDYSQMRRKSAPESLTKPTTPSIRGSAPPQYREDLILNPVYLWARNIKLRLSRRISPQNKKTPMSGQLWTYFTS